MLLLDLVKMQLFQAQPLRSPGGMTCKNQMFLKKSPSSLGCLWNPYFSEALHVRCLLLMARKPRFIYSYSWSFGFFRCLTTLLFHSSKMFAWFTFWTSLFFKVYVSGEHSKLNLNLSANESPFKGLPLTLQVRNLSSFAWLKRVLLNIPI